jgi:hypothetical protein
LKRKRQEKAPKMLKTQVKTVVKTSNSTHLKDMYAYRFTFTRSKYFSNPIFSNIMKYLVFALFALCLFSQSACKNNTNNQNTAGVTLDSLGNPVNAGTGTVGSASAPSADVAAMIKSIQTDFFAGRAVSHKYDSTYTKYMDLAVGMKNAAHGLTGANLDQVKKLFENTMKFTLVYEEHRKQTGRLDSLAMQLTEGKISRENAQKVYDQAKVAIQAAAEKLPSPEEGAQSAKALKAEFEAIFSSANKKAAGH